MIGLLILTSILVMSCSKKENMIKIGFINSLTGQYAPYGKNNWNGVNLAVEEINTTGGINGKKIKMIVEDDKSTKDGALSAVNKLILINKVPVIIELGSSVGVMG